MRGACGLACDTRQAGLGAELREQLSRGIELETAPVLIASSFTHSCHQEAGLRFFVRHLQIPPDLPRPAQRRRRIGNLPFGKADCASRVRGRSVEKRRADRACDLRQFCGGGARVLEIGRGKQDIDGSGKHSGAGRANARVEQNTADRRGRGVDLTLGDTKQRQAWLRLSSALVRARVRRFSVRELAPQSMDLTDAVERRTSRRPGRQHITRILRVPCGIIPFPAQLHDFGAIQQALTAVAHQVGLSGTPFAERHGPLVRATQIEGLLTGLEDDAIDVTRENRRHVACNHRDHRFVEQRNTLRDVVQSNQRAPASGARERRQITIAKPAGDLGCLRECGVACRGIALHDALDGGRNQQIPANDAVEVRVVENAFSSREPSRRWRDGTA